jgi:hypothetical protein
MRHTVDPVEGSRNPSGLGREAEKADNPVHVQE